MLNTLKENLLVKLRLGKRHFENKTTPVSGEILNAF
jgi:hypothetical protein